MLIFHPVTFRMKDHLEKACVPKKTFPISGNPAIFMLLRSVAFRPTLPNGLAFSNTAKDILRLECLN